LRLRISAAPELLNKIAGSVVLLRIIFELLGDLRGALIPERGQLAVRARQVLQTLRLHGVSSRYIGLKHCMPPSRIRRSQLISLVLPSGATTIL
jgi:hypothetical protein